MAQLSSVGKRTRIPRRVRGRSRAAAAIYARWELPRHPLGAASCESQGPL